MSKTEVALSPAARSLRGYARWRWWEMALFAALPLSWLLLPGQSLLLNEIAIVALFAVSLDLILGYAGIVTLGHAAYFGLGAYGVAFLAKLAGLPMMFRNSRRVSLFSRKAPSMVEVTMVTPVLCTPRVVMH